MCENEVFLKTQFLRLHVNEENWDLVTNVIVFDVTLCTMALFIWDKFLQ